MVHTLVRGLITADLKRHFSNAIQAPNSAVRTRGHTFKLKTTRYRLNIAQHLFLTEWFLPGTVYLKILSI